MPVEMPSVAQNQKRVLVAIHLHLNVRKNLKAIAQRVAIFIQIKDVLILIVLLHRQRVRAVVHVKKQMYLFLESIQVR
tara:strand:- start:4045 stop:4278 length:234 start_codon:yes stop_codon:yes gene_type:complete